MRLRLYSVSGPAFRLRSLQNADMVNNPAKKVLRLLGEDGKQLCSGTRYLPEDCLLELTRIPRAWNKNFQAVLATDSGGGKCAALECILCVRSHNLAFQSHLATRATTCDGAPSSGADRVITLAARARVRCRTTRTRTSGSEKNEKLIRSFARIDLLLAAYLGSFASSPSRSSKPSSRSLSLPSPARQLLGA